MSKNNNISVRVLKKVLSIQSYRDDDDLNIRNYIKAFLKSHKIHYSEDKYKNIYVTKGKPKEYYPCVVSHVDTVHSIQKDFNIKQAGDYLYAFNNIDIEQTGIGGDDKVGVYLTLQFLKDNDTAKAVFFRNEEIGHLGSRFSIKNHSDFYKDCGYIIQPDRYGNNDFIKHSGGIEICSEKFLSDLDEIITKYNYKKVKGVSTDVDTLVEYDVGVSCTNISCGYYRPHSDTEVVSISDVSRTYSLITDIVKKLKGNKYEFIKPKKTFKYYSNKKETKRIYPKIDEFAKKKFKELDLSNTNTLFVLYPGFNNWYMPTIEEPLKLKDAVCPECGNKTVYYSFFEQGFYCTSSKCNKFIENKSELTEKAYVQDIDGTYYYLNTVINAFITDKCIYDKDKKTYRYNH